MTRTALLLLLLVGCAGGNRMGGVAPSPDDTFAHRYEGLVADGRTTLEHTVPDSARPWLDFAAPIDSVRVRHAPVTPGTREVPVEVLFKGSLPDLCMAFNTPEQLRTGNIITMKLRIRREQGSLCSAAIRPYRLYVQLEGLYAPGQYTLKVNQLVFPFEIRGLEEE